MAFHSRDRPVRVLVVDDEPDVMRMMARSLLEAGYAVYMASNGPDAFAIAEELPEPADLLVADLRMQPMSGGELAERMFARGLASRFLFVSGFGPAVEYNEQFGPFLSKPFSAAQIVEAVARALT